VVRMLRVGFEVRLTVRPVGAAHEVAAPGEEDDVTVVLTRSHSRELGLDVGSKVWLSANRGATTAVPRMRAVGAV
jgi:sulfate transport system ATP-binding protein